MPNVCDKDKSIEKTRGTDPHKKVCKAFTLLFLFLIGLNGKILLKKENPPNSIGIHGDDNVTEKHQIYCMSRSPQVLCWWPQKSELKPTASPHFSTVEPPV